MDPEVTHGVDRDLGLAASEIRQRRVGAALPAAVGVPGGLAVPDEQDPAQSRSQGSTDVGVAGGADASTSSNSPLRNTSATALPSSGGRRFPLAGSR